MLGRGKKILLSLLLSVFLLSNLVVPHAKAGGALDDTIWYSPSFGIFVEKVFDTDNPTEIFGERYTHAQVIWIIHSFTAYLTPDWILSCTAKEGELAIGACLAETINPILDTFSDAGYNTNQSPTLANTIDALTKPGSLSGIGYVRGKLSKIHIIEEVHAQGFGFSSLTSVQELWAGIRNIAYFLMVLAFIIMAFMIMFRMRLSPQTVITVQSALPKLIITLILITFSYAIAGFIIDLSYVAVGLLALASGGGNISTMDPIDLFQKLLTTLPLFSIFMVPIIYLVVAAALGLLANLIPGVGFIVSIVAGLIILIFLAVFVLIMIRILWLLIRSTLMVLIFVIFSPIMILMGAFPGGGGFGTWVRGLISHLAVFPGVIFMVFLAHFFFWSNMNDGWVGLVFGQILGLNSFDFNIAASTSDPISLPGFQFGSGGVFAFLSSFAIIFMIPRVGTMIQSFMSGRPFSFGSELGAAIGGTAGQIRGLGGKAYGGIQDRQSIKAMDLTHAAEREELRASGRWAKGDVEARTRARQAAQVRGESLRRWRSRLGF